MADGKMVELGNIMLEEVGAQACLEAYETVEPYFVGVQALGYGDINKDGTLN